MSEPWLDRWREGRIGWHEPQGNRQLKAHWRARGRDVLVPLCGKSADLAWLEAMGNRVTGVELSGIAARAFFEEQGMRYETDGRRFSAVDRDITIVCADYFDFRGGPYDALYDRGALVALPAADRPAYVRHTDAMLTPDACRFVVTLEYDESMAAGPPFSVTADEVSRYWPDLERVSAVDDIDNAPPKFRAAGLREMTECVWMSRALSPERA